MDKINNIFFDFFGVISSEVTKSWLKNYCKDFSAIDDINKNSVKVDMGEIGEDELFGYFASLSGDTKENVIEQFISLAEINSDLVKDIEKLKSKYNIYLLSNACAPFLRRVLEKNNLYHLFDKIYISSEIKRAKPNADFYEYVLKDLVVNGKDAVMIDDRPINIDGAKAVGINGIMYKNINQLKDELHQYKIEISDI